MKRIVLALMRAYYIRKSERELYALSDHALRDIGLRREEIRSALLERVVLAEPRLAEVRTGRFVAKPDRRRQVPASELVL